MAFLNKQIKIVYRIFLVSLIIYSILEAKTPEPTVVIDGEISTDVCVVEECLGEEVEEVVCEPAVKKKPSFAREAFEITHGKSTFRWENKLRMDGFFGYNNNLLNKNNYGLDKSIIPGKFLLDSLFHHYYHNDECSWDTVHLKTGIRLMGIFGAPESTLRTAPATIKEIDAVQGSHIHPLAIHIPIVREIWGEFTLNDLLGIGFANRHSFTIGLFPFSLGRGIALGDAYAVTPDFVGYDPFAAINQYCPGLKISGEILDKHLLDYDLYWGLADNLSESFNSVNLKTQGQFYGHRFFQARGFGVLDYILAGRLKWTPISDNEKNCSLYIEPYALYNNEADQKVEVSGDASSSLGTIGLACEVRRGSFEVGFDIAHNIGHQNVKGLDRNSVVRELRVVPSVPVTGDDNVAAFVNSHVVLASDGKTRVSYNVSKPLQAAINAPIASTTPCSELEQLNGQIIPGVTLPNSGSIPPEELAVKNATNRFRDPYINTFSGAMMVVDFAYKYKPNLRFTGTLGYSSGDENPNQDLDELNESSFDGDYSGFIGLQELYIGKRVRSAFLMSGYGKIPRILSFPVQQNYNPNVTIPMNEFPTTISRFTNLAFVGGSIWWEVEDSSRKWEINPNILTFWQPVPPRIFDTINNVVTAHSAHSHLGTEINIFMDVTVAPGLKLFLTSGVWVPGQYYTDLKGHPLNPTERRYLESLNRTGDPVDFTPTLGDDNAFFMNLGIEYRY